MSLFCRDVLYILNMCSLCINGMDPRTPPSIKQQYTIAKRTYAKESQHTIPTEALNAVKKRLNFDVKEDDVLPSNDVALLIAGLTLSPVDNDSQKK